MIKDMKHNIQRLIMLLAVLFAMTGAKAQNEVQNATKSTHQDETLKAEKRAKRLAKLRSEAGLFNHLSVGLNVGLTGLGIDAVMPVHRLVTLRAGFSGMPFGDIKFKAINTATELNEATLAEDDAVRRSKMVDKVELALKPKFWNFYVLGEVHPFKGIPFYFSAGLFMGSQNFLHFRNTNDGALGFLNDANMKVQDYNRLFRTNYPPIGLKFGDYVFTADENGNIDVRMKTNAVKPYVGIGFGQHIAKMRRVSVAVDAGLMFWGSPKFVLNNGTEIKSSGKESGITSVVSWLKAWPNLEVRVAYKIF